MLQYVLAQGDKEQLTNLYQPLDSRILRQLEQTVSKSSTIGQGQKLKVVTKVRDMTALACLPRFANILQVNPEIRGGLIVEVGDRTIDLSVSAKMARMNKLLKDQL